MFHAFQGDVIFVKIDKIPEGKKIARKERGYVLAEGEHTGNTHIIEDEIVMVEKEGVLYIGCDKDVIVKHEEHNSVTIPAGNYEIRIAKEYDHFTEEAKKVRD